MRRVGVLQRIQRGWEEFEGVEIVSQSRIVPEIDDIHNKKQLTRGLP